MPIYHKAGRIPPKRHSVFRNTAGSLFYEELVGSEGFSGLSSLLYHLRRPTSVLHVRQRMELTWAADADSTLRLRHFRTRELHGASPVVNRTPLLFNADVAVSFVRPERADEFFYRNAQGDELVFVSEGSGVLESQMGELPFRKGDYVVIPRGILHRYRFDPGSVDFLIIESAGPVRTPLRYRNDHGQLLEVSPFCERDIRRPEDLTVYEEQDEFPVVIKSRNQLTEIILDHHPFDVVGWDGYYYPWALNIEDFEPRVGRFHLPPPVHQTFEGEGYVICSFCPRPYDFDPAAIPAPYNHSNVMSDEVIYYANAEFMSRKGIEYGSITFHPCGMPHGPQPGRMEDSIGKESTNELAVMLDTFRPLRVSRQALEIEDKKYYLSWKEGSAE
ncbi:MAG: homogentisate 1,2-dioxygenase [Acidobacteria bacterium]|nr:homogentisate 1,2-dioxygenase [Acidobacteriota bacterium]